MSVPLSLSFTKLQEAVNALPQESQIQFLKSRMKEFDQQEVAMTGFAYQSQEGTWILSSEPNLKSCCVGSANKVWKQVFLEQSKDIHLAEGLVTVRGRFAIASQWDINEQLVQVFAIKNINIEVQELSIPWATLGLVAAGLLLVVYLLFSRKKRCG